MTRTSGRARKAAPARDGAGTLPRRTVLPNGMVVIARRNPSSPSITLRLTFQAGAAFDPPGRAGTAEMTAGTIDRGCGSLSAAEVAERFDFLGASCVARSRRDALEVEARLLAGHLPQVLDLLRLIVREPAFPDAEVERERAQLLTAIAERDQDTRQVAEETLAAILHPPGHPYHASALGDRESVGRIGRDDLAAFHGRRFAPTGAIVVVTGDVEPDRAFEAVAGRFGSWVAPAAAAGRAAMPEPPALSGRIVRLRPLAGKTQADIAFGFPAMRRTSPEMPAAMVLSSALGEFSLGGRLGASVREKAGLAYYAYSRVSAGLAAGAIVARAGVTMQETRRAVDLMRRTIAAAVARGFTAKEIADSKQALAASVSRHLETNPDAALFLADCEFYGLGIDYPQRLPALVAGVTRGDVHALAEKYLTLDRCAVVVAGPDLKEEDLR
jgi:zinc protease